MSAVLTAKSILVCPHGFPFSVTPDQRVLSVDGEFVVTGADLLKVTITSCTNQTKCTNIASITAGLSTTLLIGTDQVALDTAAGTTNVGGWQVQRANQEKLEAT